MPAHFLCFFSIYHFSPDDFFVSVGHRVLDLPFSLEFVIRSFIRYFVIQGIVLDKLYLIKLRITNSKKRAIFLKIYFKYIIY